MVAVGRDGGVWQRVNRKERCPVCGHDSWCGMIVGEVVACMRQADGARFSKPGKDGQLRHYHDWPDRAAPIPIRPAPERPVDWAAPAATTCRALYTAIATRYAGRPHSKACAAEATRRFGDRALDALAAADYCEIDERDLLAWLDAEGRVADAKSAGVLTDDGKLAPALKARKVYAFRLPDGTVANLRGRDLTGRAPLKVLDLAGSYEERGADAGLYHHERVADVADGGGWLHLAGGCEKADALIAAGFCAVSTPGEGTLFDAALADLTARRVLSVAVWVDAEDPKEGEDLSAGRRLGLAVAERLAAAGISVRVVEPAREPGSPKRDADGILRDGGPGALWDCWAASEDLAAFRARVGVVPPDDPDGALVLTLREQLREARQKAADAIRLLRATRKVLANGELKQEGRAALGLAYELWERRDRPDTARLRNRADGENFYRYHPEDAGKKVAMSASAIGKAKARLQTWGLLKSEAPAVCRTDPETGEEQWTRESYLHIDAESIPAWLEKVGDFKPSEDQCEQAHKRRWGGPRWHCEQHPDATIEYTTTARCTQCGRSSEPVVEYVDRHGEVVDAPMGWPENRIPLGKVHLASTIDTDSDDGWLQPTFEDTPTREAPESEDGAMRWEDTAAWSRVMLALEERDGKTCHYCGIELEVIPRGIFLPDGYDDVFFSRQRSIDHKVPISQGGTDDLANLVLACRFCNTLKGVRSYETFVRGFVASIRDTRDRTPIPGEVRAEIARRVAALKAEERAKRDSYQVGGTVRHPWVGALEIVAVKPQRYGVDLTLRLPNGDERTYYSGDVERGVWREIPR